MGGKLDRQIFFNKVSDFLLGIFVLLLILNIFLFSSKKKKINFPKIRLLIFFLLLLLFEWFYNHPTLRYGGYCIIASIIFLFFAIRLNKYKLDKNKLIKSFNALILITIVIFLGRNLNRIINEVEFYSYKPMKNVNYMISEEYFDIPKLVNKKITNYNLCNLKNQKCKDEGKIKIKKYFNNYILYLEK